MDRSSCLLRSMYDLCVPDVPCEQDPSSFEEAREIRESSSVGDEQTEEKSCSDEGAQDEEEDDCKVILKYVFDSKSETRMRGVESRMNFLQDECQLIKKQLTHLQEVLEGGVEAEAKLNCLHTKYKRNLKTLHKEYEEEFAHFIKVDKAVTQKEETLSRQLALAVSESINSLVDSGHLIKVNSLMTDEVFKQQVDAVIVNQLMQYNRMLDKICEMAFEKVSKIFDEEFKQVFKTESV